MNTLIIGSTGYVGRALVSRLTDAGYPPATLDRHRGENAGYVLRSADNVTVLALDQVGLHLSRLGISTVVNLYASTKKNHDFSSAEELLMSNVTFPALIASTLKEDQTHFIQIGTYSHRSVGSDFSPQTLYAATKFAAEHLIQFYAERFENLRVSNIHCYDIYGPNHHKSKLIPSIVAGITEGQKVVLSKGMQDFAPIHISDVVRAIEHLIDLEGNKKGPSSVASYDLYGPEVMSIRQLATRITKTLGADTSLLEFERSYRWREVMKFNPCHSLPSGFTARVGLEEGIGSIVA